MKIEEFNPAAPELEVNGTILTFKNFTLYEKAWAIGSFSTEKEPNGLVNLSKGLESLDAVTIAKFAWRLVENKKEISMEEFFNYAENNRNLMEVLTVLNKILKNSQPSEKFNSRMKELKKS